MTDAGATYTVGRGPKRFHPKPTSLKEAKARLRSQMACWEANCRDRIDIGYAGELLYEAFEDYVDWVHDNIGPGSEN